MEDKIAFVLPAFQFTPEVRKICYINEQTKLLLGYTVEGTVEEMIKAAKQLVTLGCKNVLVKGGHVKI